LTLSYALFCLIRFTKSFLTRYFKDYGTWPLGIIVGTVAVMGVFTMYSKLRYDPDVVLTFHSRENQGKVGTSENEEAIYRGYRHRERLMNTVDFFQKLLPFDFVVSLFN